mmetsp:Transcript_33013/g.32719  ORF Transcript_33013/g.32719 Transcript_33013/m.32719 type:complete len:366 (+) Transcript_33013:60-1157(+)
MPEYNQTQLEVFKGEIYIKNESNILERSQFMITQNYLVQIIPNSISRKTSLDWKIIEPFTEDNGEVTRYGFSVGHRGCSQDFYVENEENLDIWINHLSKKGIMTDFENDFAVVKEIGNGSFGTVYLVVSNETSELFAMKSINKHNIGGSVSYLNNLVNEIKFMRSLNHPNIVKLHYVYESPTHIYLLIDYVEGGDLFNRIIKRKVFEEKTAATFAQKFLGVLDYLSSFNIAHRDIKLENILMVSEDNDYDFKLADFGLAADATEKLQLRCGSPGYIAPEVLRKIPYDTKVDVFSAGVILYILLSGKMPFPGKNLQDTIMKNRDCKISFLHPSWKNVSKYGASLVLKLTEPIPNLRPSANEALKNT